LLIFLCEILSFIWFEIGKDYNRVCVSETYSGVILIVRNGFI
jgi:hypothetical protein